MSAQDGERFESAPPNGVRQQVEHYAAAGLHPWDAMRAWMSVEQQKGFLRGNVIKYLARYDRKGGVEDLVKAQNYLTELIVLERANPE